MEEKLVTWTHEPKFNSTGKIRKAQIFRLRNVVQNALVDQESPLKRVNDFLEKIRSRESAKRQFENAFLDGERLMTWLEGLAQEGGKTAWQKLEEIELKTHKHSEKTATTRHRLCCGEDG